MAPASRRAVSLSCEVEFHMAPNLPEQCLPLGLINRIFVGFLVVIASLTTKMIYVGSLLDRAGIAKVGKIWTLVIVLIVA